MTPTVFVAILSHPDRAGRTIAPQEGARRGMPLHLSLHTSDEAAVRALDAAMVAEWNDTNAPLGLGPAELWDRAARSRRMVEDGYLAAVVERPVSFAGEVSA